MKILAVILAASSVALGSSTEDSAPPQPATLRIDSFHGSSLAVDVFSRPAGLRLFSAPEDSARSVLRVQTPATLLVGDSVEWLRIAVIGEVVGAVRFSFDADTARRSHQPPFWGRDVALRRVDGKFMAITQIIPLYP
jgi:hypothetical protein